MNDFNTRLYADSSISAQRRVVKDVLREIVGVKVGQWHTKPALPTIPESKLSRRVVDGAEEDGPFSDFSLTSTDLHGLYASS